MTRRFLLRKGGDSDTRRVFLDDRVVGSIAFSRHAPQETWNWSLTAIVSEPPGAVANGGAAPTLANAMAAFRATWEAIEARPHWWVGEALLRNKSPVSGP